MILGSKDEPSYFLENFRASSLCLLKLEKYKKRNSFVLFFYRGIKKQFYQFLHKHKVGKDEPSYFLENFRASSLCLLKLEKCKKRNSFVLFFFIEE